MPAQLAGWKPAGSLPYVRIIRQLHDVVEIARRVVAPDLKHINQAFVRAGDRFEALDARKLAFGRAGVLAEGRVSRLRRVGINSSGFSGITKTLCEPGVVHHYP